jgi:hypothetical protein
VWGIVRVPCSARYLRPQGFCVCVCVCVCPSLSVSHLESGCVPFWSLPPSPMCVPLSFSGSLWFPLFSPNLRTQCLSPVSLTFPQCLSPCLFYSSKNPFSPSPSPSLFLSLSLSLSLALSLSRSLALSLSLSLSLSLTPSLALSLSRSLALSLLLSHSSGNLPSPSPALSPPLSPSLPPSLTLSLSALSVPLPFSLSLSVSLFPHATTRLRNRVQMDRRGPFGKETCVRSKRVPFEAWRSSQTQSRLCLHVWMARRGANPCSSMCVRACVRDDVPTVCALAQDGSSPLP